MLEKAEKWPEKAEKWPEKAQNGPKVLKNGPRDPKIDREMVENRPLFGKWAVSAAGGGAGFPEQGCFRAR